MSTGSITLKTAGILLSHLSALERIFHGRGNIPKDMLFHKHLAKVCGVNHKLFVKASAGIMLAGLDADEHANVANK